MELMSYKLKGRLQQCHCFLKPIVMLPLKYTLAANHMSLWTDKIFGPSKDSETVGHKIWPNEVSLSLSPTPIAQVVGCSMRSASHMNRGFLSGCPISQIWELFRQPQRWFHLLGEGFSLSRFILVHNIFFIRRRLYTSWLITFQGQLSWPEGLDESQGLEDDVSMINGLRSLLPNYLWS